MESKNSGTLIILSGPSGVGKGTIIKKLLKKLDNIVLSISATTRLPRRGEKNGIHYYFISRDKFIDMIKTNGFLEYAEYNSNYYGTPKDSVNNFLREGKNVILEIDVQGAFKIKNKYKNALMIFVMPPCVEDLYKRLRNRNTESGKEIEERVIRAQREIELSEKYDYVIINDSLSKAAEEIKKIISKN
ncbi:MAG: guanylate kinase [Oscillospiraceae bacterium]|nr:guanylate kinase [Oscillospiraceae bacterium]